MVCIQPKTLITDISKYIWRISKKFYTYNFYSFNKSEMLIGAITIFIFFIYIISNIILTMLEFQNDSHHDDTLINNYHEIIYLIGFETHLFFEILCPLYYKGMTLKESFKHCLYFFFFSNCSSILYFLKSKFRSNNFIFCGRKCKRNNFDEVVPHYLPYHSYLSLCLLL